MENSTLAPGANWWRIFKPMIKFIKGSIFDQCVDALVNPVNCRGVMGAGLAKEFAERFPWIIEPYRSYCKSGLFYSSQKHKIPGLVQFVRNPASLNCPGELPRYVVNFPTKDDWAFPSQIEWIELGLNHLTNKCKQMKIKSIAVPMLGCGLGSLRKEEVSALFEKFFSHGKIEYLVIK